jgi:hypothetical protein
MGTYLQNVHSFLEQLRTFRLTVCGGLKMLSIPIGGPVPAA